MQLFASCVHVVPSNDFHSVSPQVPAAGVVVVDVVGVVVVVVGVVVVVVVVVGVVVEDEDDVDVVVGGPQLVIVVWPTKLGEKAGNKQTQLPVHWSAVIAPHTDQR